MDHKTFESRAQSTRLNVLMILLIDNALDKASAPSLAILQWSKIHCSFLSDLITSVMGINIKL